VLSMFQFEGAGKLAEVRGKSSPFFPELYSPAGARGWIQGSAWLIVDRSQDILPHSSHGNGALNQIVIPVAVQRLSLQEERSLKLTWDAFGF
jgi:hypothetical protein